MSIKMICTNDRDILFPKAHILIKNYIIRIIAVVGIKNFKIEYQTF